MIPRSRSRLRSFAARTSLGTRASAAPPARSWHLQRQYHRQAATGRWKEQGLVGIGGEGGGRRRCDERWHRQQQQQQRRIWGFGKDNTKKDAKQDGKEDEEKEYTVVSFDRSGLGRLPDQGTSLEFTPSPKKPPPSPLCTHIANMIKMRGPISVAEFMTFALQHPTMGYYTSAKRDQIGREGDFITAPEISQTFGEMLAVWCVATWQSMGSPSKVHLVELGPGKGTLMKDMLRAAKSFPEFQNAITVHLVETSPKLKAVQAYALGARPVNGSASASGKGKGEEGMAADGGEDGPTAMRLPHGGGDIFWHRVFDDVPAGPLLVVAQELLDALPVHQFEYAAKGWCERLVDVDESDEGDHHLRFVLSAGMTQAAKAFLDPKRGFSGAARRDGRMQRQQQKLPRAEIGDQIEVCPLSLALMEKVAERVGKHGGGALLIDYGEDHALGNTLRAFKHHKEVHVLAEPGLADLTCDVNFDALKRVVKRASSLQTTGKGKGKGSSKSSKGSKGVANVDLHGPIGQGYFLEAMGLGTRMSVLLERANMPEEEQQRLYDSFVRLVHPDQMGARYKVLAVVDRTSGSGKAVAGFPPLEGGVDDTAGSSGAKA